jgi:holo-[acyl-carrier protein] synthase
MQAVAEGMSRSVPAGIRLGFDLVQVSQVAHSLQQFGMAFETRLFTEHELAYARSGAGLAAERLAARFAAKEAVIKALALSDEGVNWRDIEVHRLDDGDCSVRLHGRAAAIAANRGVDHILVSLSHDGDYAGAVATVLFNNENRNPSRP